MIEVEGLRKKYGDLVAVDGVSFTAEPGKVFGLLGPNGAGKSTTIGCLAGLLKPTGGRIRILGCDLARDGRAARRQMGVVPQELALYEDLSGLENLHFWGAAYGLSGRALKTRAHEVLEAIGLADRGKELSKRYSGGMKRRLNLGCGIVHAPRVLLLDEPTAGVDPQSRVRLLELVRAEVARGTCVLYTTHYMEEAEALCDQLAIVDHGRVIAAGTLAELRAQLGQGDLLSLVGKFNPAAARAALAAIEGVELASADDESLQLVVDGATRKLPELFAALAAAGAEIRETTLAQANLESLFLRLTGKKLREWSRMSSLLSAARKDLRRFLRDPWAMVFWLGLPLVIGALVELAIGGHHGRPERPRLLVADQDDSFASRLLRNAAREGQLGELFAIEETDQPSGRALLDAGEATALVVIPEGFGAAVLADEPTRLTLVTNPEERIRPRMIEEMLDLVCDAVFYAQRLLRGDVRAADEGAGASRAERLTAGAARLGRTALLVERYALPPVIELETATSDAETRGFRLGRMPFLAHYLPGIVFLAMLFASQGLAGDIWRERETGVLRRVVTTPLGITRLLAAKLLAAALVLAGLALTVLVIGMLYTELPLARLPLALVWSTAAGVMLTAMMLLLQVFATTHRGAQVLSFAVVMPLMILGGSIFPIEVMPAWMAAVGRATPNGWAGAELKAIVLGRVPEVPIALGFALLAATGLAFIAAAAWRTSRVFARR